MGASRGSLLVPAAYRKIAARPTPRQACAGYQSGEASMPDLLGNVEAGVTILTLNRPETLNALSDEIRLRL